jgi:hypothetical protein
LAASSKSALVNCSYGLSSLTRDTRSFFTVSCCPSRQCRLSMRARPSLTSWVLSPGVVLGYLGSVGRCLGTHRYPSSPRSASPRYPCKS